MASRKKKTSDPSDSSSASAASAKPKKKSKLGGPLPTPAESVRQTRRETDAEQRRQQEERQVLAMPVAHPHAAGIDVGDKSHWVCVDSTPDGSDRVREFPAHTLGLQQIIDWLKHCGVTSVALEASGAYGSVLFLHLQESGFHVIMTSPHFARQIKGRPKTDKRDCQWIQRLHKLGLLPQIFQPDDQTQTLRHYVRQRANHVRLSGQHIQRMQKALILMNLKLTSVLNDVTGVTGLKIIRAIINGERDPQKLAKLRDRRCGKSEEKIAIALTGRYRDEHVLELKLCYEMWKSYQQVIAQLDEAIHQHLQTMKRKDLPPLPKKPRVRGRKPHDPKFDVRTALYFLLGIDLTAIHGIDEIHALTLVSELGTDFSKWPTVKHFASWLGLCPNWKKTGGKVKGSATRKGKNRAAHALRLAAWSLMRSKSYLGASMRRQKSRLGAPKAITAMAHKLARIIYNMVRYGVEYVQRSEREYADQYREKQEKNLHRRAKELGYELKKIDTPTPEISADEAKAE